MITYQERLENRSIVPKLDSICFANAGCYAYAISKFEDGIFYVSTSVEVPAQESFIVIRGRPKGKCRWTNSAGSEYGFRIKNCSWVVSPTKGELLISREYLTVIDKVS